MKRIRVPGYQLDKVQRGEQPGDVRPMLAIGKGVEEIRVSVDSGTCRVIYMARRADAVCVFASSTSNLLGDDSRRSER